MRSSSPRVAGASLPPFEPRNRSHRYSRTSPTPEHSNRTVRARGERIVSRERFDLRSKSVAGDDGDASPPPPAPLPPRIASTPATAPWSDLPISRVLPECLLALERGHLVLEAPPGAGKTTALPLALLAAQPSWLRGDGEGEPARAILVVEPRRLAATAAARRMASLLGGETSDEGDEGSRRRTGTRLGKRGCPIGYAVRGDSRCSSDARVVVVTPGVATRLLLDEFEEEEDEERRRRRRRRRLFSCPIGAVFIDEAHERSAEVDLIFALLAQRARAGDGRKIRVIFASATLGGGLAERAAERLRPSDPPPSGSLLPATVVRAPAARAFPVSVTFAGPPRDIGGGRRGGGAAAASLAAAAAAEAVSLVRGGSGKSGGGDVLVFLPGVQDIRATAAAIEKLAQVADDENGANDDDDDGTAIEVLPLHGGLPPSDQDRVLSRPRANGRLRRRIVLSTPVAESSLTVPGVTAVVDSGLSRVPRLDASRGVERLTTVPISRSSAEQRSGRAGREAPGRCVRLWSEAEHARRSEETPAEVSRGGSDLAPLALSLVASAPRSSPSPVPSLPWLDRPHEGDLGAALSLLRLLGLVELTSGDENEEESAERRHRLTAAGKAALELGSHPRLSRMLLCSSKLYFDAPELGCVLAAVCSERDFVLGRGRGERAAGASAVDRVLALAGRGPLRSRVDGRGASRVLDAALVLRRQLEAVSGDDAGRFLGGSEEEDDDAVDDDGDGGGDESGGFEALPQQQQRRLRRHEARAALARAAADAVEKSSSLAGFLIACAYPDRVATRKARGGRDRSAAFVLGGNDGGSESSPATAVLPAGSRDPLLDRPALAIATLGTSATAARSSSLVFLAAPLEVEGLGKGRGGGTDGLLDVLRSIPGLVSERERRCRWVPSAAKLVCTVRSRVGGATVREEPLDPTGDRSEITDDEAGRAFVDAVESGGGLAALREPAESRAWRRRVCGIASSNVSDDLAPWPAFAADGSLGSERGCPEAIEALLPALSKCRTARDLEELEWVRSMSEALLTPEQARRVEEEEQNEREAKSSGGGDSVAASSRGGSGAKAGGKASKKKGRPKR